MRLKLTRSRVAVLVIGAAAIVGGTAGSLGSARAASGRQSIPNTRPAWLGHAKSLGHASAGASVSARIYLTPNGGMAKLKQFALAVSTPGNAQFRHFLKPSQYFQRFGTTAGSVSGVKSWLTGAGLRVTQVEQHNRYVEVSGNVAKAEAAFGVSINRYRHDGLTVQAPTGALSAPAGVASSVLAVSGVDTTPAIVRPATQKPAPPEDGFRNASPCSASYGDTLATNVPQFGGHTLPYAPCGYVGSQFRSAYEGSTTLNGAGVTVAITDAYASPNIASDAATYASATATRHTPQASSASRCRRPSRAQAARRRRPAGTARRRSTSRPSTRWRRERRSATTPRRAATTPTSSTRSRGSTTRTPRRSSRTPGAATSQG